MENKIDSEKVREQILHALKWRYATKVFDPNRKVTDEEIRVVLESARLSPSVFGIEAWKFLVIQDINIRAKLFEVSKQSKVTDASHLIVITYRTDITENVIREKLERTAKTQNQKIEELEGLKAALNSAVAKKAEENTLAPWIRAQSYIPLGIMIETASLLGVDNCPMEGFQNAEVDKILGLAEKNLKSVTMLALGYRGEDPASTRPKIRREFKEAIEFI